MYEKFYDFKERPFNVTSDPAFFFLSRKHKEAFSHLIYGIEQRKGILEITGEIGTGKTTLARLIATLTESGSTTLWMSRLNSGVPIYALTPRIRTRYRVSIYRDVYPLLTEYIATDRDQLLWQAEEILIAAGAVENGDLIVLTIGEPIGQAGGTNTMKLVKVGEHRPPKSAPR